MANQQPKVLIIGAGLTGLTAAYFLKKAGIRATILEARARVGGRIHTLYNENAASFELGATWLGQKHHDLRILLKELGLDIHEQVLGSTAIYEYISTSPHQSVQLPPNTDPSYRIKGGSSALIQALANQLDANQVCLNQPVKTIHFKNNSFDIQTDNKEYKADILITTLPPNLLVKTIDFNPSLPTELIDLSKETHTWMGESIKVGLRFKEKVWAAPNLSGTIMSNVGPVGEMYEHSNPEDTHFALKGFLNGVFQAAKKEERKQAILNQLRKYFGNKIEQYTEYLECVWRKEKYTFADYNTNIFPHQHNGDALFRQPYFNGQLLIAGSETAPQYPGYMDGAVQSGKLASQQILTALELA